MTLFYYDPVFLEHKTGNHPESPSRLLPVVRHLNFVALDTACRRPAWQPASTQQIERVHDKDYLAGLRRFVEQGGGLLDADTVTSRRSYDAAVVAAGAVCDAVQRVLSGDDATAFCLLRPPGHHALSDRAMGFCLINNVAVGARLAVEECGLDRVLIVDWDVHHGNGTQAIFWEDPQVGFFSMHRWPFYPGTGDVDERGSGPGLNTTVNVPIEYGTSRSRQLHLFRQKLTDFADRLRPQLVLISAGFDSHKHDPVGSLGLESKDFRAYTQVVQEVADTHANGKIVSVLEGGYNPLALTECIDYHLECLLGMAHRESHEGHD